MSEILQGEVYRIDFGPAADFAPAERHPCVVTVDAIRSGLQLLLDRV